MKKYKVHYELMNNEGSWTLDTLVDVQSASEFANAIAQNAAENGFFSLLEKDQSIRIPFNNVAFLEVVEVKDV